MARDLQPCGTRAAYQRHLKRREVPCGPCTAANTAQSAANRDTPARRTCKSCRVLYPPTTGAHGWCPACWMRWDRAGRPEAGPPPVVPLRAIEGNASSSDSPTQSPILHALPGGAEPAPETDSGPLYDHTTGEDHRTAAPFLADLRRKWSHGT